MSCQTGAGSSRGCHHLNNGADSEDARRAVPNDISQVRKKEAKQCPAHAGLPRTLQSRAHGSTTMHHLDEADCALDGAGLYIMTTSGVDLRASHADINSKLMVPRS